MKLFTREHCGRCLFITQYTAQIVDGVAKLPLSTPPTKIASYDYNATVNQTDEYQGASSANSKLSIGYDSNTNWCNSDYWNDVTQVDENTVKINPAYYGGMSSTPIACLKSINLFQLDHKIVYFTRNKNSIDGRAFYGFYNPTINKRIGLFSENCGLFNGSRNGLGNEETEEWYTDIDFKWGSEMSIAVYDIIPGDQYYIIFRNYTDEIEYEISIPFHDSIVGYYLGFNDFRGFGLTISNIRIEDTDY